MTSIPTTRASLLLRLSDSRDREAWLEFLSLYEPVAYRFLRRQGLQDADARELMQELFLVISRNINRWDSSRTRGSFRGWLRKVTRNLMINWLKRRERSVRGTGGSDMLAMLNTLPDDSGSETAEFDQELRRALFHRAAEHVKEEVLPATWQAFWETAVIGTPSADVAARSGMSVGAIRVARCRVLARLKVVLNELEKAT